MLDDLSKCETTENIAYYWRYQTTQARDRYMKLKFKTLTWTEPNPPNKDCSYDHCYADTPFGQFRIEWKSWKEHGGGYVVYFHEYFVSGHSDTLDEAKESSAKWYAEKIVASLDE